MKKGKLVLALLWVISTVLLVNTIQDLPEVEIVNGKVEDVENGKCRYIFNNTVCFSTLEVMGFDTGIVTVAYSFGESSYSTPRLYRHIFLRESSLCPSIEWSESSFLESLEENDNIEIPYNFQNKPPELKE